MIAAQYFWTLEGHNDACRDKGIFETGPSEAETTTLIYAPDYAVIFPGDIVTNYSIPAPFESLENWLIQLDAIEGGEFLRELSPVSNCILGYQFKAERIGRAESRS